MSHCRVRRYGRTALLVETPDPLALAGPAAALPGVIEVVPAARTVLLRFDPAATNAAQLTAAVGDLGASPPVVVVGAPEVVLVVDYDGPDLAAVAEQAGLSTAELVRRHTAGRYTVAFCGFAPGFAYLTGLDPRLHVPRRAEPRTRVPAGSVAVAGEYAAVYPRASPGGWNLLGRTDAVLWQPEQDPPARLVPGTTVRFTVR